MAHFMVLNHVSARKTSYLMNDVIRTSRCRRRRQSQLIHYWIDSPDVLSYTALIPLSIYCSILFPFHPPKKALNLPNLIRHTRSPYTLQKAGYHSINNPSYTATVYGVFTAP